MKLSADWIRELVRFAVVGGVSFVIDFGFLIFFQELVFKSLAYGVFLSTALAFTISLTIHYFLATFWVFRGHDVASAKSHAVAGSLFVITNLVGFGINELSMYIGVTLLGVHYIIVKLVATAVAMVWNYGCQKLFIFKKSRG